MKRMGLAGIGGPVPRDPNALDFDLLTTLTGYRVVAEDYGLREDQLFQGGQPSPTEKDIEKFENLRDLYWWYCKMDVYQTLIGGTKLLYVQTATNHTDARRKKPLTSFTARTTNIGHNVHLEPRSRSSTACESAAPTKAPLSVD
jgi:hypothetical protein